LKTARARSQRGCDETASPKYLGPIVKLAIPAACGKSRRVNGAAAVGIMRAVKQAIDPNAIVKSGQEAPLPFFNHFGVGLPDEPTDPRQRLAPPITQLLDSPIDQPRGRGSSFSFPRAALTEAKHPSRRCRLQASLRIFRAVL
jgi:hypothetical protein